jgi:hypothetical protein
MEHGQLTMVADKFPWVVSAALLHACGKDVTFCRRQRLITPLRLGLARTATCASPRVETIADLPCRFQALFGTTVTSTACSHQVAKPPVAAVARLMTARLIRDRTRNVLGFKKGRAFTALRRIVLQDGSACAIHEGLRAVFPGRVKVVKPAAVALHTTMALLCAAPTTVGLPPDTTSAPALLPEPSSCRASGLLADRGSVDLHSLRRVQDEGGLFRIRAKAGRNPQVLAAFREAGQRLRSRRHQPLQTIHAPLPQRQRVELRGPWSVEGAPLCLRLMVSGNRWTKSFCSFLTNRPATPYSLAVIGQASKGRWQGDLRCNEWNSSAHLPALDTANPALVEGLLWTARAAAALTRVLAQMTPLLVEVPMSTRTVAMCAVHVFGGMVQALKTGEMAGLYDALQAAVTYLACHAQRAHPQRDRQTGRAQLGLEPCFAHDDVIEFANAA